MSSDERQLQIDIAAGLARSMGWRVSELPGADPRAPLVFAIDLPAADGLPMEVKVEQLARNLRQRGWSLLASVVEGATVTARFLRPA